MPTGLEISSRPSPVTSRPSEAPISFVTMPGHAHGLPGRLDRPEPFAAQDEPEPVDAVRLLGRDRPER